MVLDEEFGCALGYRSDIDRFQSLTCFKNKLNLQEKYKYQLWRGYKRLKTSIYSTMLLLDAFFSSTRSIIISQILACLIYSAHK